MEGKAGAKDTGNRDELEKQRYGRRVRRDGEQALISPLPITEKYLGMN
jgi:hypothetical protein